MTARLPGPVRDQYVVIDGRRFPAKRVLGVVTGHRRPGFTGPRALRVLQNADDEPAVRGVVQLALPGSG